jgi:hypothetical protein
MGQGIFGSGSQSVLPVKGTLYAIKAGPVIYFNKNKVFHFSFCPDPAPDIS